MLSLLFTVQTALFYTYDVAGSRVTCLDLESSQPLKRVGSMGPLVLSLLFTVQTALFYTYDVAGSRVTCLDLESSQPLKGVGSIQAQHGTPGVELAFYFHITSLYSWQ